MGNPVGWAEGWLDGIEVGLDEVGRELGALVSPGNVGRAEGWIVGCREGSPVGQPKGCEVGTPTGWQEGLPLGLEKGCLVG